MPSDTPASMTAFNCPDTGSWPGAITWPVLRTGFDEPTLQKTFFGLMSVACVDSLVPLPPEKLSYNTVVRGFTATVVDPLTPFPAVAVIVTGSATPQTVADAGAFTTRRALAEPEMLHCTGANGIRRLLASYALAETDRQSPSMTVGVEGVITMGVRARRP